MLLLLPAQQCLHFALLFLLSPRPSLFLRRKLPPTVPAIVPLDHNGRICFHGKPPRINCCLGVGKLSRFALHFD